ncbi:isoaspartyl peptidase/L-asparaginase, partial [Burkholderia multivorans]|uniref:isoaspartyl peptidase/L-asparaginase n=1 Tax=Burkholderia multivorans TaxID=87883 RepID=UPI00215E5A8B
HRVERRALAPEHHRQIVDGNDALLGQHQTGRARFHAGLLATGGITNKQPGRVGDSPIIGAGCYADDATCAVSATGTGEMFIRLAAAHDVAAQIAYRGATLAQAAHDVVMNQLPRIAGRGGIIAVDAFGNVAMPFNTEGMYRGHARVGAAPVVGIYRDDDAS